MSDVRWYQTLALWKSAVFLEGSYKRLLAVDDRRPVLRHPAKEACRTCSPMLERCAVA